MKSDNTTKATDGQEVYTNDIYFYADEYINTLPDPNELYKLSSSTFTGLIKYINRSMGFDRNRKIHDDIELLNDIWNVYVDLVYKYNQKPTLLEYCLLIGISRDTIYKWLNGEYRKDDYCNSLSLNRADTVKKWQEECKLGRYKGAAAGNVGYIFLCKAVDGMAETAPVQTTPRETALTASELPKLEAPTQPELCENGTQLDE